MNLRLQKLQRNYTKAILLVIINTYILIYYIFIIEIKDTVVVVVGNILKKWFFIKIQKM